MEKFSEEVCNEIGNYVYRLVDPRNAETFYVGKGVKNRVFDHVTVADLKYEEGQDALTEKISRIKEIQDAGYEVQHIIHRHKIDDAAIFEVEAALIDAYPRLTNIQSGHGSNEHGPMTIEEINDKYALPEITEAPTEKLLLININKLFNHETRDKVYDQTRAAWKVSEKACQADYILSVYRGIVVGVFTADQWLPATHENFPELIPEGADMPTRKGFIGKPAPDHIQEKFFGQRGKRIAIEGMKHVQNPIRFWNL